MKKTKHAARLISAIAVLLDGSNINRSAPVNRFGRRRDSSLNTIREFTFTNAAMLHTRNDPAFLKGTVVEGAVADELGLEKPSPGATA
jgi:hypothetical protein